MLKSKLEKFLMKRALICMVLMSAIDIIVIDEKWHVLTGLLSGTFVSIFRFGSNALILSNAMGVKQDDRCSIFSSEFIIVLFGLSQLILLPLLFLAYFISQWVFAGFIAGIITIPVVIMVNSITEAFGITKNHFE